MRWINGILDWIGRWQVAQSIWLFAKPFLLPSMLAAAAGGAGWFGHLPLMWIIMAAALTFMGSMVGIFFGGTYRDRITAEHKVRYLGTHVGFDLNELPRKARRAQATGAVPARTLSKVQVGVVLHNSARFPISVILEHAETEVEGELPPRSMFPRKPTLIVPGNTVFVMDDAILMHDHACEKLDGHMDMRIRYGFPGREKHHLQFAARLDILMRPDGVMQQIFTNWDSPDVSLPTNPR
jgi:hypothetical protein